MSVFEGKLLYTRGKIGIIVSRFNSFITERLLDGCLDVLKRHGTPDNNIDIVRVPGSFEIPIALKKMMVSEKYIGIACLGALIRGSTSHFDYLASEVTKGIANLSLEYTIPVIFGVLTTENIEQAIERAGTKLGNKGAEAGSSLLEMINLLEQI